MVNMLCILFALCLLTPIIQGAENRRLSFGFKEPTDALRAKRETCSTGQYYDPVTDNCDECAPHCDRPSQSLPAPCTQFCTERGSYRARMRGKDTPKSTCDVGLYHDDVTGNCDPCKPHCDRIPINDPPDACRSYCSESMQLKGRPPSSTTETSTHMHAGVVAAIVLSVFIAMVAVGAVGVLIRNKRQAGRQNIRPGEDEPIRHSVEETNSTESCEMVLNPSNV